MNNFFCIRTHILRNTRRHSFHEKYQVIIFFACLNGFFAIWEITIQASEVTPERVQGKIQSVEAFNPVSPSKSEKININLASIEELRSLPGIGVVTAKRIVDYRKKNPPFRTVEELLIIRGISKNRLEQIRNRISVN